MANGNLILDIRVRKWALPLLYICVMCRVKPPRFLFSFVVRVDKAS